jgi:hypothetical protein
LLGVSTEKIFSFGYRHVIWIVVVWIEVRSHVVLVLCRIEEMREVAFFNSVKPNAAGILARAKGRKL